MFRTETKLSRGCPSGGVGEKYPYFDFGWAVLTEELLLRK